ncbi:sugar phosphate isomerase/epimerase family protein [Actomonas aquatica]|uniref:Sugar phosphate isomerase/epimerase family protein n=1 Tax=Actomonas aquatica TaxID=2866162 RepID=A0ABZ1C3R4_9BACT|nr:sugar phosphate isomerase/epimerase family protein [Opitutus sp. WL0086]WRQ86324.1 sugar phosphate isomerase/epimerase family protein [Opitutus sp. WL0086]
MPSRRTFVKSALGLGAAALAPRALTAADPVSPEVAPWFDISLAQWSLQRDFWSGARDKLRFAAIAKNDFGISAVEYVNQFYLEGFSPKITAELKRVADGEGVHSVLIMCDRCGRLGDPDPAAQQASIDAHLPWLEAARTLGCHAIRVNAFSDASESYGTQLDRTADGLRRLCEIGDTYDLSVIVEPHGGLSSNGAWLAALMDLVAHPRVGTLPDFGNYGDHRAGWTYDRYLGTTQSMPYAKGVSGKTFHFDASGEEDTMDFRRLIEIVHASGFSGYIDVEYEGDEIDAATGIRLTRDLLVKLGGRL